MIAVSLPDELLQKLDNAVAKTGKKRSYLIRESIQMYLNQIENTHEKKEIILNTSKPFYEILIEEFQVEKELMTEARKTEFSGTSHYWTVSTLVWNPVPTTSPRSVPS